MKQKEYSFHSSGLQKVNQEAESIFTSHLLNLDRISKDIKTLEETLRMAAIPFFFIYVFSSENRRYWRTKYLDLPDGSIPDGRGLFECYEEHCLVWGKNSDNQYRLSYNVYVSEDELEEHEHEGKERIEIISRLKPFLKYSKPLIESKAHIRINIENELPHFYRDLIRALKSEKGVGVVIDYTPEFSKKHFLPHLCISSTNSFGKIEERIFTNE